MTAFSTQIDAKKSPRLRALLNPFSALLWHRSLVWELSKRDVLGRYRGASFGLLWALISPFLVLGVYTFAFGFVMKNKWPQVEGGQTHFSIILFVALIVHGLFSECLTRSPSLVVSQPNFVKKVIFPLQILPWPMLLSALFHAFMNLMVFMLLRLFMEGTIAWTIIFFPVVILPLAMLSLGVAWALAALGVYLRDIGQITGVMSTALLFMSSAMIPLSSVPASYRGWFELNPLTFIIDQAREVCLWQHMPDWQGLGIYAVIALAVMYAGYGWFASTQRGFADVL
ncbi:MULTISPECIES: ABC transporter permease [Luteibacter]|uniref:ABC transporter permease n=1 Tax=Luteibacter TaxID=242605 RepID=UPI0009A69BB1|nr:MULTISPECIES: ABC transporter permease [unclassified Luteibacter]